MNGKTQQETELEEKIRGLEARIQSLEGRLKIAEGQAQAASGDVYSLRFHLDQVTLHLCDGSELRRVAKNAREFLDKEKP